MNELANFDNYLQMLFLDVVFGKRLYFQSIFICDALRDLLPFVQLKKRENTHGGVLILVTLY